MSKKLNNYEFLKRFYSIKDINEYSVLSEYEGHRKKMIFKHNFCGTIFYATANNMLHEKYKGCPYCGKMNRDLNRRITYEKIKQKLIDLYGDDIPFEYDESQYYKNNKDKIFVCCKKCKTTFDISISNMIHGRGCPICNSVRSNTSKNHNKIFDYLTEIGCNFKCEYTIDGCKKDRPLRFDFAILDNNENLLCVIEYDGEFHDRIHWKDNKNDINYIISLDSIKNSFCNVNNIPLLRISHKNFSNFKEKIDKFLKDHTFRE